jgi:hypothetical protein
MNVVCETDVPHESELQGLLAKADFWDAYRGPLRETALTPTEISFGGSCDTAVGLHERVNPQPGYETAWTQGRRPSGCHLDVRASVLKVRGETPQSYVVATVVNVHNWLGRFYMIPVGRIHPLVVKVLMPRAAL